MTVQELCRYTGVSRASFYRHWNARAPQEEETALRDRMQQIALANRKYGYRRVTKGLRDEGYLVNGKRILRMMREDNLLSVKKRRFVITTDSNHSWRIWPNLAKRMVVTGVNQLWVADITYIRLREEFCYLAVVLDVHSRRIVGWALERQLTSYLAILAMQRALESRKPEPGLVHHSDRGVQYAAEGYANLLEKHGVVASMSRPGNPWDNAYCESFMSTLKREQVEGKKYRNLEEARAEIGHFLDEVYNKERMHSALKYMSPEAFEKGASPSSTSVRQTGDRVQAALTASLRLGLDPDPSLPKISDEQGEAPEGEAR